MTINFICGVIAELFNSPCNFSPIDEYMFQDNFCESHCGEVENKDCWKRYFEKRWEDSKMSEIPTSSEKPNNCETCANGEGDIEACGYCRHGDLYEPKTEPQTDYTPDCPFCRKYGTEDCLGSDCRRYKIYKTEALDKDTNVRSKESQTKHIGLDTFD